MLKKIFFELVAIRKELQAIRSCLESKEVSTDIVVDTIRKHLSEAIDQSMSPDDVKTYRSIADRDYGRISPGEDIRR